MRIPKGGIGFFDSGIGGLTVLAECSKHLKNEILYYYGDNAHAPYGNLKTEQMRKYIYKAFNRFRKLNAKAVVIACNTVTALFAEELRARYPFPIIGTEPAVFPAAKLDGEIFVLTTRATFESDRLHRLLQRTQKKYTSAQLRPIACDRLAGEIERHIVDRNYNYAPYLPQGKPAAVVLGCTHYVYIKEYIRKYYGCEVIDGNAGVARRLLTVLQTKNVENRDERPLFAPKKDEPSCKNSENGNKEQVERQKSPIFFIGSGKKCNAKIFASGYEQMFVL
ncbi:MAG: aspartate/glutamate racemase family protein [Clostridia bacterium]|nr:aspartate/glutamate racemase family protein [Clostridia bacterium]